MDYRQILLGIAVIQLLGAASPGPTFIVVSSYSINQSRRYGLLASLGVLTATFAWAVLAHMRARDCRRIFPSTTRPAANRGRFLFGLAGRKNADRLIAKQIVR